MKFSKLAGYLDKLEKESSRILITEILADLFSKTKPNEIDKVIYLLLGRLAPRHEGVVFNIAERIMLQIISQAFDENLEKVNRLYKSKGDLGDVSFEFAKGKGTSIGVTQVFHDLYDIAQDEGMGSQERKINKMSVLLSKLDPLSVKYVVRIPVGKLRLGFSEITMLDALSWMELGSKDGKKELEKAYYVLPDAGHLAKKVKELGIKKAVKSAIPIVGIPVLPMLAQRLKSPSEMIKKMHEVAVEPKFDGLRIILHYKKGKNGFIKAFTRNLNETSWMFPELKNVGKYLKANDVILDTEAVGVDQKRKVLANFQTTMTRRRKYDIDAVSSSVPIKFYVFDILYRDGKNLMEEGYKQRRRHVEGVVINGPVLEVVDSVITKSPDVIEQQMKREISEGLEGIIVKKANSKYVPGRTGWRWVKMKEEENSVAKLADTLDCVVMGYYSGRGKRSGFGIGGFLVGVINKDEIQTLTKTGTGLTDEQFRELKKRLSKLEVNEKPKQYGAVAKHLLPDYWVEPKQVVEIAADEITKSPTHSSGYALRFPRLVNFRDDKGADSATSLSEVKRLFKLQ